jgi:hypothetical protein
MRASLLHPIAGRRQVRRQWGWSRPRGKLGPDRAGGYDQLTTQPALTHNLVVVHDLRTPQEPALTQDPAATYDALTHDPATQRARDAGGPADRATYACGCGFLFAASVSTTVACPHCGTLQAW